MQELVGAIDRASALMDEVAAGSREQGSAIEQINTTMIQIDTGVHRNATLVTEASAASRNLTGQAEALVRSVSSFRLPGATREHEPARGALPPGRRLPRPR
jgi:methyl-accepting chemotaxis protein